MGATVIATAGGAEKLAIAKAHGADHLIDYRSENIREPRARRSATARGADVVFDPVGGEAFDASLRCANWGGRLIVVGFAGGQVPQIPANILLVKNLAAHRLLLGLLPPAAAGPPRGAAFAQLFGWWRRGTPEAAVSHRFDLAEAAAALALLRERKATGKVVLTTARPDLSGDGETMTGRVRAQYEAYPYPPRDPQDDEASA